jgi:hypothetical protein
MAVQPVYGPDYAKLVLQGLQTYRGIKGQQQQDEQYEYGKERQAQRDIREEERYVRQKELEAREDEEFKLKRFQRERATTARKIEGKPVAYQIQEMEAHIQRIKDRGGDSRESENLLEMLRNQDPAQQQAAQQIISDARVLGEDQGILKRRGVAPGEKDTRTSLVKNIEELSNIKAKYGADSQEYKLFLDSLTKSKTGLRGKDAFESETALRKEYTANTKDFKKVQESYRRIKAVEPTAAGDLALIFNYMKMLDPGSVVRESEYATAQNSAGVPERIRAQYNRVVDGQKLGAAQRKDFRKQASNLYGSSLKTEKSVRNKLKKIAKANKLNPENVFFEEPEQLEQEPITVTEQDINDFSQ